MSSTPSSSKTSDNANKAAEKPSEPEAHLGVLEEDDEFEEFEVAGACCSTRP
jgi:26 proteasome complex subunit DSS1